MVGNINTLVGNNSFEQLEEAQKYLRSWNALQVLDTKILSVKLTMILALTAALRENEIKKLDIQYMVKVDSEFTFSIAGQQKQVSRVTGC